MRSASSAHLGVQRAVTHDLERHVAELPPGLEQRPYPLLFGEARGEHDVATAAGARGADGVDEIGLDENALARDALRGEPLGRERAQRHVDVHEVGEGTVRQLRWSIQATAIEPARESR